MNEALKAFITGLGVVAESTKASYDAFLKSGFKPDQALYLSGEFMKNILKMADDRNRQEDE